MGDRRYSVDMPKSIEAANALDTTITQDPTKVVILTSPPDGAIITKIDQTSQDVMTVYAAAQAGACPIANCSMEFVTENECRKHIALVHSSKINTLFCPCCDLYFEATRNVRPILQHMQELHSIEVPFRYHCCSNALYRMHWFKFCSTVLSFGRQPYPTKLTDIQLCIHLGLDQKNMRWSVNDVHQNSGLEPPWPSSLMPPVPAASASGNSASSSRSSVSSSPPSNTSSSSSSPSSNGSYSDISRADAAVSRKRSRTATKTLYDELSKTAAAAATRTRHPSAPPSRPSAASSPSTSSMPIVVSAQRAMRNVTDETFGLAALIASIDDDEMAMATMPQPLQPLQPPRTVPPPPPPVAQQSHYLAHHHQLFSYPHYQHQHQHHHHQQHHHQYEHEHVHSKEVPVQRDNSKRRRVEVDPTMPPSSLPPSFSRSLPQQTPTFYDDNFLARIRSGPAPATTASALHAPLPPISPSSSSSDYPPLYHHLHHHHQHLQHNGSSHHQYYPHYQAQVQPHDGDSGSNLYALANTGIDHSAMHRRASAPLAIPPHSPLMHPSPPFHPVERERARERTFSPVEPMADASPHKRGISISDLIHNSSSSSSSSSSSLSSANDSTADDNSATSTSTSSTTTTLFVPKKKALPKSAPLPPSAECPSSESNAVPHDGCATALCDNAIEQPNTDQACVPTPPLSWPDSTPSQPAASQLMVDQSNLFGNI